MVSPIRFEVGQKVRLTTASFQRAVASNHSTLTASYPSGEFLRTLGSYVGGRGTIKHAHAPGYDVTVEFYDHKCFHMKDSWIEPDPVGNEIFVSVNKYDAEDTIWFDDVDARVFHRRSGTLKPIVSWLAVALDMALHDKQEYTTPSRAFRRYTLHSAPYNHTDPVTGQKSPRYAIVYPGFINPSAVCRGGSLYGFFRVIDLWTGNESSLYSAEQCENIIAHALDGALKGSFGL